jgi:hypothetical protein
MSYFVKLRKKGLQPRVHSLLLSLASENEQDIASISEDDPRIMESVYYIAPARFPPLDMHFNGQNSASPSVLFNVNSLVFTSADDCRECQSSQQQDNPTARKKGLKHRRVSSGGTHGNSLLFNSAKLLISA